MGIEAAQVVGVGREHRGVALPSAPDHRRVDHVSRTGGSKELTHRPSRDAIEWDDLCQITAQQASETGLTLTLPPHLGKDSRGHNHALASLARAPDEHFDSTVCSLDSDECAGIEHDRHPSRTRSAQARSSSVIGPPDSSSILSKNASASSSATH